MASGRTVNKDKLLKVSEKVSDLLIDFSTYIQFVNLVKNGTEYTKKTEIQNLTEEMEEVCKEFKGSLKKIQNYLRSLPSDEKLDQRAIDLIKFFKTGHLTKEAKSFGDEQGIVLSKDLTKGTKPTNVSIDLTTIVSYSGALRRAKVATTSDIQKFDDLQKLMKKVLKIDEDLGDLKYDTEEKDSYAGVIKRYRNQIFKEKNSLRIMEIVFPEVKKNNKILLDRIENSIKNISQVDNKDIDILGKAVSFLDAELSLDPALAAEIHNIIPEFSCSVEIKKQQQSTYLAANLATLRDCRNNLFNYGASLKGGKSKLNSHQKGFRNTLIVLGTAAVLVALSGGVYHLTDYVKGKENLSAQSNTVDSGIIEESDSVNTAFIKLYQEGVANRISELKQKAEDEAWAVRLNGQDALNKLQAYIDGTNKNLETLNSYNEDALAGISSNDLIAVRSLMELYYNSIIADLDAIEDSVGVILTQNISKDVFEQVNFTTLKTATGNSIQSVSVDFVKDENGNYDSKMEIVVKSYDSMTKKEFYKYFVISTEDALTYLTDGELLDVNAIQAIQDNGKITKSGIDYKYILENEGTYLPQEVSHIYMNGVSEAIKKGKYTVSYKVVLVDGSTIENNIDVENLKATNQTAVVKAVYKNIFSLIESKIEANENQMQ